MIDAFSAERVRCSDVRVIALFFPQIPNIVKFSGAVAAMLIELLPINIDDNLRIPLFSGFIMYILSVLFI